MKKKILIIDDFEPLLEEIADFLNYEGFQTYSAKNGIEGVQMAIQYNPDLIICDIEMPKMNGFEVFKTLEKIPATESVPFIFLTARAQADDYKSGLKLGADDYITKPLEMDILLNSIIKRLKKYEKIKNKHRQEFEILFRNPFVGIFIFKENKFYLVNDKFQEITTYTKSDLNNIKLSKIIINEPEFIISKLKSVLSNLQDSVRLKLSVINKNKRALFIDFFAKYIEIENKNALIGTITEFIPETKNKKKLSENSSNIEYEKIIDYLITSGKNEIAEEILNVRKIISFYDDSNKQKLMQKIKLTKRETEILYLICNGMTNNEIAEKLFISNRTVDNHRANLLSKTNIKNTASLVAFAFKNKLINI